MMHVLSTLVALLVAFSAAAQNLPAKPIRIICPFPPAGAVDITSRAIAHELTRQLGVPVTVENRPGAGGNIGGAEAVRAAPDGTTLFMTTSPIQAINPALYSKMPFDPNKDFAYVSVLVALNNILVVNPGVKANSMPELVALAKAQPGRINFASSGHGTSIHLSAELFKMMTGVDIVHIVYKGSAPAVADLISGQVNMMFDNIPSAAPHVKSGKLRALAVTGAKRHPLFPDVPTVAEAGLPGYEATTWFGLTAPAATPKEIVARLAAEAIKGTQSKDFRERMEGLGYEILGTTPERMAEMSRAEIARWVPVVKASGARVD